MGKSKKPGYFNTFFGFLNHLVEDCSRTPNAKQRRGRVCRIEELEARELLAVSLFEFNAIREQYTDLPLSANMSDYNIIEITQNELSARTLQAALNTAAITTQNDLIVVRTAYAQSVIELGDTTLSINIDSSRFGSVTLVALGSEKLQISGVATTGVLTATDGTIVLGGIVLNSTNNTLNIDNVLKTAPSVQLVTSQFVKTVEKNGSGNVAYANAGLLMPLTAGSAIGLKTYEIDIQIGGTVFAYLTGLSLGEKNAIISNPATFLNNLKDIEPYDAEKSMKGDSALCWAASTANMLAYTGWGNVNGFQTEDDIFAYFVSQFTNNGGHQFYANEWFLTGKYAPQGSSYSASNWSKLIEPDTGGGFYPSVNYTSLAGYEYITSVNSLTVAVDKLKEGCAIGMSITGHALTFWGVVYDTSKIGTSAYYVSIFITDSDDNKPGGVGAPNILRNYSITWTGSSYSMYMTVYGQNSKLVEFVWLTPFAPPKDFHSTEITDTNITLAWTAREGATGYYIQWWKADDPSNILSQSVSDKKATTITISALEPGTTYVFQIFTVCGIYESIQCAELTKTTIPCDYNALDWKCVENQGLGAYATWTNIGGEYRLTKIDAAGAGLSGTLDLSPCDQLVYLNCSSNRLTKLNLTGCKSLQKLYCGGNALVFSTLLLPILYSGIADFGTQALLSIPAILTTNTLLDRSSEYFGGRTSYTWYYAGDNTVVNPALYQEASGKFTFTGITQGTVIYCVLTNSIDFPNLMLQTTPVTIVLAPSAADPVRPFVMKKTTINSITLTWNLPAKNRDYISANYVITCTSHSGMAISSDEIVITGNKAVVTIAGLVHSTKYRFSLAAVNADGKAVTVAVAASTKKYNAMKWLRVNKSTLSSVTFTSLLPLIAKQTDGFKIAVSRGAVKIGTLIVTGLDIEKDVVFKPDTEYTGKKLTLTDFTLHRKADDTITKFSMTIDGLSASKKHSFSVRATAGEFVSSAKKISGSTKKYTAVTNVKAIEKTDSTITLTWEQSKWSETTHYTIAWLQEGVEKSMMVDKNTLSVKIIDLTPSTMYTFSIRAVIEEAGTIIQQSLNAKLSVRTATI